MPVNSWTVYQVQCCLCKRKADADESQERAAEKAKAAGFRHVGCQMILCGNCCQRFSPQAKSVTDPEDG